MSNARKNLQRNHLMFKHQLPSINRIQIVNNDNSMETGILRFIGREQWKQYNAFCGHYALPHCIRSFSYSRGCLYEVVQQMMMHSKIPTQSCMVKFPFPGTHKMSIGMEKFDFDCCVTLKDSLLSKNLKMMHH